MLLASLVLLAGGCSDSSPSPDGSDGAARDGGGDAVVEGGGGDGGGVAPSIAIDGLFDDWAALPELASDASGDQQSGGFDVVSLRATSRGSVLYLSLAGAAALNLFSGPAGAPALRVELSLPAGKRLTIDLLAHAIYQDGDPARTLTWGDIAFLIAPTYAAERYEMRVDLARLGVKRGDRIGIDVAGADALAAPVELDLSYDAEPTATPRDSGRAADTTVRVVSLNTQFDGLHDSARRDAIGRLLHAAAGDIYVLQEITNVTSSESSIAARLKAIDPHGDGASWNVHLDPDGRGRAIASRSALLPLPKPGQSGGYAAVALTLPGGQRLVIFDIHPVCCGYAGSSADKTRNAQLEEAAQLVKNLRGGTLGASFADYQSAPIIAIGDWNLVASRTPLDVMTDPNGPALERWPLRNLVGDDSYTWVAPPAADAFPPGTLDHVTHTPAPALERRNGFVLDSGLLDAPTLSALGLQKGDSAATDHRMLVADFKL
ncbi:MAG: endonuclease/exonuclease/phosphatase family protein [Myxococcales bacterium]|nr:endonuclease/exonuclease/phosphatase family protein [Myxococcales bacterium]